MPLGASSFFFSFFLLFWGEPVWPSGKALGWQAEGLRFDPLRLSFLFKNCGLWTLSCDFANTID